MRRMTGWILGGILTIALWVPGIDAQTFQNRHQNHRQDRHHDWREGRQDRRELWRDRVDHTDWSRNRHSRWGEHHNWRHHNWRHHGWHSHHGDYNWRWGFHGR